MNMPGPLQGFWDEQVEVISVLQKQGEFSLAVTVQNIFSKSLVLTAASFFETEVRDVVTKSLSHRASHDQCIISFCRRKGIDRQFHTWFEWDRQNANSFFSLFGDDYRRNCVAIINERKELEKSVADYLFIGRKRNELVHQNFLTYSFDETADQVRDRIISAVYFVKFIDNTLMPSSPA